MTTETTSAAPAITSTQRIFDAVRDLREVDQIATRETVAELTGLKMAIVDDRLRALVDDGKLKRLLRGVYELVETYPQTRNISKTILDSGYVMIEIAGRKDEPDIVLHLTPNSHCRVLRVHPVLVVVLVAARHSNARTTQGERQ